MALPAPALNIRSLPTPPPMGPDYLGTAVAAGMRGLERYYGELGAGQEQQFKLATELEKIQALKGESEERVARTGLIKKQTEELGLGQAAAQVSKTFQDVVGAVERGRLDPKEIGPAGKEHNTRMAGLRAEALKRGMSETEANARFPIHSPEYLAGLSKPGVKAAPTMLEQEARIMQQGLAGQLTNPAEVAWFNKKMYGAESEAQAKAAARAETIKRLPQHAGIVDGRRIELDTALAGLAKAYEPLKKVGGEGPHKYDLLNIQDPNDMKAYKAAQLRVQKETDLFHMAVAAWDRDVVNVSTRRGEPFAGLKGVVQEYQGRRITQENWNLFDRDSQEYLRRHGVLPVGE